MKIYVSAIVAFLLFAASYSYAQDQTAKEPYPHTQPTSHLTDESNENLTNPFASKPAQPVKVVPDKVILAKVKSKIATDTALSSYKMNVSSTDGIVTLDGTVKSDTDASALVQIAQSIEGVKDVNTKELKIENSTQPFTDIMITAKIKGTYLREKLAGKNVPAALSVETNNGVVYLSGSVDTKEQEVNAENLAKAVNGVKSVNSRIKVSGAQ